MSSAASIYADCVGDSDLHREHCSPRVSDAERRQTARMALQDAAQLWRELDGSRVEAYAIVDRGIELAKENEWERL